MIFLCSNGREKKIKNVSKYLIDWDSDCRSGIQKDVKDQVKPYWFADVVFEEFPVAGTRMTLDLYNATQKIAIEVDGNQHYKFNRFFHSNSRQKFLNQLQRDEKKEQGCPSMTSKTENPTVDMALGKLIEMAMAKKDDDINI